MSVNIDVGEGYRQLQNNKVIEKEDKYSSIHDNNYWNKTNNPGITISQAIKYRR